MAGIEPKPVLTAAEVVAVQACIEGQATAEQAKMAIDWIMREAARVPDLSFRPGQPDYTTFNEGRRYVGILIRYMLLPETLAEAREHDRKQERKRGK